MFSRGVWSELGCRSFREYLAGYFHLDIYLLKGVLERYRKIGLNEDGLDPIHFVSLPALTFASCFKMTGKQMSSCDIDMTLLKGIRGGLASIF